MSSQRFASKPTRYPSSNSTQGSFSLTVGLKSASAPASPIEVFPLNGVKGAELFFGGAGADNTTYDYRVYVVRNTFGADGSTHTGLVYELYCTGSVTLGAVASPGGTAASNTERMADTVTAVAATAATTPKGSGGVLEAAMGSTGVQAYSPANDTLACVYIPHLGWADGLIVEFDTTGATSAFVLIGVL